VKRTQVAKLPKHGRCGCGRTIKPKREHNDPEIWACIACGGPVCDWCYHAHHNAEHERRDAPKKGASDERRSEELV